MAEIIRRRQRARREQNPAPERENLATRYLSAPRFSYWKHRYRFLAVSLVLILLGIISSFVFGIELDIQFRGGSILQYSYTGEIDATEAENLIEDALGRPLTAQTTRDFASGSQNLVVNIAGDASLSPEEQATIREALDAAYPENGIEVGDVETVSPFIGRELLMRGLAAVLIASALIVVYVWIRFRSISGPSAGVFALLCLLHDIVIAFFVFVAMRAPLNETVIAVILSILGWSVNDTIVIYDRIRENVKLYRRDMTLAQLVDMSITQSLTRSVTTSGCAFLAIFVAYIGAAIYGIDSIREFTLPMMVGIAVGSYSSIVLAAPFWVMWKTRGGRSGYES
ncbi:MAG: protein translocase subunit SecF [Bacillota bacterium]|nr:protein translocase subunit SecF [Bacillota bacterium]